METQILQGILGEVKRIKKCYRDKRYILKRRKKKENILHVYYVLTMKILCVQG